MSDKPVRLGVLRRYLRRYFHRKGRMRRWVVRPFIWGLFFLILVVAAAWLFLESGYAHERVPTNDGGLCLGQLAVAAHTGVA